MGGGVGGSVPGWISGSSGNGSGVDIFNWKREWEEGLLLCCNEL